MPTIVRYAVLIPVALAFVMPFYWMVVTSLDRPDTIYDIPPRLLPQGVFANYAEAWRAAPWPLFYFNTVLTAGLGTLLAVATSSLAGYAFACMRFRAKPLLFGLLMAAYMIPLEVTLVPNYLILGFLGWLDSYQAQFVPFGATVFGIFLMRQYFSTLPADYWEAAQLDGCSHFRYLLHIAIPIAKPAIVTLALFHFVGAWNAFLWPLIVTSSDRVRPLQVALSNFSSTDSTQPVLIAAGALMTTLPVLIVFLFAQRQLVGGIAASGVRG
jgi:multiple sugar transport system permease protein